MAVTKVLNREIIQGWCWRLACQVLKVRCDHWGWGMWLCGVMQMYSALNSFFHTEHETARDYTMSESQPLESSHSVSISKGGMVSISSGTREERLKKGSLSLISWFWVGFKPTFLLRPVQWSQNSLHESSVHFDFVSQSQNQFLPLRLFSSFSHHVKR